MAEYSPIDRKVIILGVEVDIIDCTYDYTVEKTFVRTHRAKPVSIQSGAEGVEGRIKLLQSTYIKMVEIVQKVNPAYKVHNVAFDIVDTYGIGNRAYTNIVKGCQIEKNNYGTNAGDANMEIELPFKALDILENQ